MSSANDKLLAFEDQSAQEWGSDSIVVPEGTITVSNTNETGDKNLITLIDISSPPDVVNAQSKSVLSKPQTTAHDSPGLERIRKTSPRTKSRLGKSSKYDKWGRPEPLITYRKAAYDNFLAIEQAEKKKYLDPPPVDKGIFPALGCYLWPDWNESPTTLLGPRLEDLNQIRLENQVWIDLDEENKCINIYSHSVINADTVLANSVKGIRDAVEHAKATRFTASPLHLVYPPTSVEMRKLIKASFVERDPPKAMKLILVGEKLSNLERLEWEATRDNMLVLNIQFLQKHLVKNLLKYAPVKHWMRLRIHFGNISMSRFTNQFGKNGTSWPAFLEMVAAPRFSAIVDRNLGDARLALLFKEKICQLPDSFCSVHGRIPLKDIKFKDTEIIHFNINNQKFRMEGEIDESFDNSSQVYQIGSNSLYRDNRRNVLVETRTIDVERGLDWKLELIADNKDKVLSLPPELRTLIKDSIPVNNRFRIDALGMQYPDIAPSPSHLVFISSVIVRSIIQYRMKSSGFIIEIAIYREWIGAITKGEPEIFCSISMFHPCWDDETQDLSNKTYGRAWKNDLSNFFIESDQHTTGLEYLLAQIRTVQDYIIQARRKLTEINIDSIDLLQF
ncbi:hypothetical protein EV44_g0984 [Erysiphe necator]|uniref:DUF7905 domain-containing protein n=1 Tax=Uncinula necator TaxID=52586 RepID=A0A0B1P489_UNCNE|nr:hypothetical protein EV44_g0984 [Erysiphe necator]